MYKNGTSQLNALRDMTLLEMKKVLPPEMLRQTNSIKNNISGGPKRKTKFCFLRCSFILYVRKIKIGKCHSNKKDPQECLF